MLLLAEAFLMTLLALVATTVVRFPWLLRLLVRTASPSAPASQCPVTPRVCAAVQRAACWPVPWAVCLPQAIAAHWMLARRGIPSQIRFGVRAGPPRLSSHAWLIAQGKAVLGDEGGRSYQPVFEYPSSQGAA